MSRWLFKFERGLLWEQVRRWAIAVLAVYLVLYWTDRGVFHWLYVGAASRGEFEARGWAAMLKSAGYLPVWMAVGAVLALLGRGADGARVVGAAALGGALAEALRPIVGQVRPMFTDGAHVYQHSRLLDGVPISFGMASSHAGVAFGAACALAFLYGRAGLVALVLAAGCGVERMMAGSHFATDIYVGALLGYASARLVRPGGWRGIAEGLVLP
jgi:membrane-associated phospholipid phosphatase